MTVPIGIPISSASSRYDRPSSSRSTSNSRKRSGKLRIARSIDVTSSVCNSNVSGSNAGYAPLCCSSSNGSLSGWTLWPRQLQHVLRTILRNHARPLPPEKVRKYRSARSDASCTTSSASCSFRICQRARRNAASKWGRTTSSKLSPVAGVVDGVQNELFIWHFKDVLGRANKAGWGPRDQPGRFTFDCHASQCGRRPGRTPPTVPTQDPYDARTAAVR
jgi:hypothetical protein